ncbi:basic amino acid ABC transporter substrate-binding protein [Streptomyces tubbatahanensis]|uniref:Basic amino acid ABC transporter substrate-binding protein n=1 Tax=Streptomyces tubbatahanensis TaxID=2923272 RepID=A0ABY3Y161_9ACTN|nr:basic amino acid ABC transporter substrate-binding protein [Streptomyces tubbatahanensis]UNT00332.1 basic amino acid ABC transporter substrate-binding protein [Streptomyces tubbatahanensis]
MSRISLTAALTAAVLAAVTACTSTKTTASNGDEVELVHSGKLTTCTHLPYMPFQYKKGKEVVGFDVDLVDLIAKDLDVEQEIVDTPFEGIQTGEDLNASKCDLAAAGMTITSVREKNLDFSRPYFEATQALLVKKGAKYDSLDDLKGKKLGVQQSTTGEEYAKKHASGAKTVQFEDLGLLLTAVKTGKVDAGINDNGVLYDYAKKNPDTEVTTEFDTGEQYGIGVRTGNDALREQIDKTLKKAKSDGRYDKLYKKWFGKEPAK